MNTIVVVIPKPKPPIIINLSGWKKQKDREQKQTIKDNHKYLKYYHNNNKLK